MSISDDKFIPFPSTFKPLAEASNKVVAGLHVKTADALDREATELENAARLKRFAAQQIRKGVSQ